MIQHVVMWNFKEENKEANLKKAVELLKDLEYKIPEIRSLSVGKDFNRSDAAYDLALVVALDSREDIPVYQNHPEHQKVAKFIGEVRKERVVVDFEE